MSGSGVVVLAVIVASAGCVARVPSPSQDEDVAVRLVTSPQVVKDCRRLGNVRFDDTGALARDKLREQTFAMGGNTLLYLGSTPDAASVADYSVVSAIYPDQTATPTRGAPRRATRVDTRGIAYDCTAT